MADDLYKTIVRPSEGIYKEKGSRFLAFVYPVSSVDEVKPLVDEKKKTYHDARHVCYAYRIDPQNIQFRMNDDGEPSGTAGRPILGCLLSRDLVNVLVIVVRYFGGIKLGVSGLTAAYKMATDDALDNNEIEEQTIKAVFKVNFDYFYMNEVMKVVKDMKPDVLSQQFDLDCNMVLQIREQQGEALKDRLSKIQSLKFE